MFNRLLSVLSVFSLITSFAQTSAAAGACCQRTNASAYFAEEGSCEKGDILVEDQQCDRFTICCESEDSTKTPNLVWKKDCKKPLKGSQCLKVKGCCLKTEPCPNGDTHIVEAKPGSYNPKNHLNLSNCGEGWTFSPDYFKDGFFHARGSCDKTQCSTATATASAMSSAAYSSSSSAAAHSSSSSAASAAKSASSASARSASSSAAPAR